MTALAPILIIDDDDLVAKALRRMLGGRYEIHVELDARIALRRIAGGERFRAILCDLTMPSMSGSTFYFELRALAPDQAGRFIIMTGGSFSAETEQFLRASHCPCLDKPIDAATLRATIERTVTTE